MQGDTTRFVYWWAYPSRIALFVHLPIFLWCASLGTEDYAFYKQGSKLLDDGAVLSGVLAILAFALCSLPFEPRRAVVDTGPTVNTRAVDNAVHVLFGLVLGAYGLFLLPLISNPQLIVDHLAGSSSAMYVLRDTLNRIPGVTTLMTLQSLLAILVISYSQLTGERLPRAWVRLMLMVVAACVLRAWLWSERLALIELALPIGIVMLARGTPRWDRRVVRALALAPLVGLAALFALFALGEYFRSWQVYQHTFAGSFLDFAMLRFAGYYATALNNGAALLTLLEPFHAPTLTAQWFYKFPVWQFVAAPSTYETFDHMAFLDAYMNPEFNNMSGIFLPLVDYGPLLGLACWMLLGLVTGMQFNAFMLGNVSGLLLYPVWYTGIAEMLRVFYWGETRFFPVILGALILARYLGRHALSQPASGSIEDGCAVNGTGSS